MLAIFEYMCLSDIVLGKTTRLDVVGKTRTSLMDMTEKQ
jgi:hypothetical protein